MKPTLTPRQERFATEYSKDLNATQAAIRAGYSPRTAQQAGSRLLLNVVVSGEIARFKGEQLDSAGWKASEVLEELRLQAHSRIGDFFDASGELKPLHTLSAAQQACISGYEMVMKNATAGDGQSDRVLKIKLWDKMKALDLAMQHFALLQTKPEPPKAPTVSIQVKSLALVLDANQLQAIRERLVSGTAQNPAESGNGGRGAPVPEDAQV